MKWLLKAQVVSLSVILVMRICCWAGMVIDHTAVDLYDDIPQEYIDEVKKMWVNIPGESHSSGHRKGLAFLAEQNPLYAVVVTESGAPEPYREDALRISGRVRNRYNNWSSGIGESGWYANPASSNIIPDHLGYCNANNLEIAAIGFGWCWDMAWHNGAGGSIDPVHQVRWAGSSVGGPEGDVRWGLDDGDYTLTGNSINMNTYLNATQAYSDYIQSQGYATKMLFTTGPVEGSCANDERGYQRYLKHEHIRAFVGEDSQRILFDYADILNWSDAEEQSLTTWTRGSEFGSYSNTSEIFPRIHSDNMKDFSGSYAEDGDHIGEVGALRLGKAIWVMMAKIAGWDGTFSGNRRPVVTAISDQEINQGGSFETITLDNYVSDQETVDADIVWEVTGATNLEVTISNRIAHIAPRESSWTGSETITLTAVDEEGASGSTQVTFTINSPLTTYYIRQDSSGNGSDWENAYPELPDILERGAVYYIADGEYGSYVFNDPEEGEKYIYIKKAIISDHGTSTGWVDSYGEGQAVFTSQYGFQPTNYCLAFRTGYWIIDGQVGGGPQDWDGSIQPLGFKVTGPTDNNTYNHYLISVGGWTDSLNANYVELHHIEITGEGFGPAPEDATEEDRFAVFGVHSAINSSEQRLDSNGSSNGWITNCYFHHNHMNIFMASNKDWVIEKNFFQFNIDDVFGSPYQNDGMKAYSAQGLTIRNNVWENQNGSGTIFLSAGNQVGSTLDVDLRDVYIYGNVFYNTDGLGNNVGTICIVAERDHDRDIVDNVNVYNNTFVNLYGVNTNCGIRTESQYSIGSVTDFRVYNNVFYNVDQDVPEDQFFYNVTDRGYNWYFDCDMRNASQHTNVDTELSSSETNGQIGTNSPITDWENKDFTLASPTDEGISLPWMDNKDMFGKTRGLDGTWDRGAIEYDPNQVVVIDPGSGSKPQPTTYQLTISISGNGRVTKNPDKAVYNAGESVTIQAIPDSGYIFTSWSGNVEGAENPTIIIMDADMSIGAQFETVTGVVPEANEEATETKLVLQNNILKKTSRSPVTINVHVKEPCHLRVKIYNSKGREIVSLYDGHSESTILPLPWDGTDSGGKPVGSGIYLIHMQAGSYKEMKKIAVIK